MPDVDIPMTLMEIIVWIHPDTQTEGGPLTTEINHVYNSSAASVSSRLGYGWTLSCLQKLESTGITDYPYVYTDADGTKHYFIKTLQMAEIKG